MYLFSLVVFIGLTAMAMILAGRVWMFFDIPSLLLIFPPAIIFSVAATSWHDFKNSFGFIFKNQTDQPSNKYIKAKRSLSVMGNSAVLLGIFMTFLGWVAIANNLKAENFETSFGSAFAVSILTLIYGCGLKLVCYVSEMKIQSLSE